jgi:(p)ppGpp synthase/HD superfamily hydrolase
MEKLLQHIIEFADNAHGEQTRKYTPERYIVHPIRVMESCKRVTDDICILAAAILHDVLAMAMRTVDLVVDLTDVYVKKDYPKLNRRSRKSKELLRLEKTSPDSQTIKYADIIDNTKEIVKQDPDFAKVFLRECRTNLKKLNKGNKELHAEAVNLVDRSIEELEQK